jgi:glycosyltransferase involved in cell wall biosynthesis
MDKSKKIAILHYSTSPVVGGVESVIKAHVEQFIERGFNLTVISGRGDAASLPEEVRYLSIPEIDTKHPKIAALTDELNRGVVPVDFELTTGLLMKKLRPIVKDVEHLIIHNVLTKHFNLPLTSALYRLMDTGDLKHVVAICHDLSWSSPNSRDKVYPAHPWNLLRTCHVGVTYVAISRKRQQEIHETFRLPVEEIPILYNGINAPNLFNLTPEGRELIDHLGLWESDLIMLMPVRVTQAKNIELALRLTAALKKKSRAPRLVVTGPPDPHNAASLSYYQSLKELRSRLGIEKEALFVYEFGKDGRIVDMPVVADLLRVCDLMLMPSHREGFGMPILEAGLLGVPIFSTAVPAAVEIAKGNFNLIGEDADPEQLAEFVRNKLDEKSEHRLRVKVRENYTWSRIFENELLPLLK